MTSDETPADVIEAAAKAVHDTACGCGDPHPCDYAAAHALHAAGLLADPAATVQAQSTLADPAGRDEDAERLLLARPGKTRRCVMATSDELRDAIRDELAHWPIGFGYESTSVGIGDAGEMADALMPVIRAHSADVWDHGHRTANPVMPDAHRDVINPWKQPSDG